MNNKTGSIGVCTVLGIIFVVLKLVGVIRWSWWAVLAPFVVPTVLVSLALGIFMFLIRRKIK